MSDKIGEIGESRYTRSRIPQSPRLGAEPSPREFSEQRLSEIMKAARSDESRSQSQSRSEYLPIRIPEGPSESNIQIIQIIHIINEITIQPNIDFSQCSDALIARILAQEEVA